MNSFLLRRVLSRTHKTSLLQFQSTTVITYNNYSLNHNYHTPAGSLTSRSLWKRDPPLHWVQVRMESTEAPSSALEKQHKEQQKQEDVGPLPELVRDFLSPAAFYDAVKNIGIDFFTGVPDSLLKDFCGYVNDVAPASNHVITCNEGAAIAMAAGYHMASGKFSMVYMQNSGLGNAINPLVSLCSKEVYVIPMLVLIGWRGEPGKKDEPQHLFQGQITPSLLTSLRIPFQPLPDYVEGAQEALHTAKEHLETRGTPYVLLVRRQTFTPYKMKKGGLLDQLELKNPKISREVAIEAVISSTVHGQDIIVGTTGMLSRELFELRKMRKEGHERDFLTVGSMGHASSIALGISIQKPNRRVICLDGDGSVIMHMGAFGTIAQVAPPNFLHIVLNNGSHDSVGGQPTAAANDNFSIPGLALAAGYKNTWTVSTPEEIKKVILEACQAGRGGPNLIEIKIRRGSRKDLGRPTRTPVENKMDFMNFLSSDGN